MANLLVVDDDKDIASALIQFLELEGHDVRYAPDGMAGTGAVNQQLPDLILLDVDMPRLNGPGMAYRLFVEDCGRENIPIVIVSGVANLRDVAHWVGTPYVISKPFSLDQVEHVVRKALRERKAPVPPAANGGS